MQVSRLAPFSLFLTRRPFNLTWRHQHVGSLQNEGVFPPQQKAFDAFGCIFISQASFLASFTLLGKSWHADITKDTFSNLPEAVEIAKDTKGAIKHAGARLALSKGCRSALQMVTPRLRTLWECVNMLSSSSEVDIALAGQDNF